MVFTTLPMSIAPEFEKRLAELRLAFLAQLRDLGTGLEELEGRLSDVNPGLVEIERMRLRALAHRLAGNGGLFGLPQLSEWGHRTERLCQSAAPAESLRASVAELGRLLALLETQPSF